MVKNVGAADRVLRVILGAAGLWLGLMQMGGLSGSVLGIVVSAAGLVLVATGLAGTCLLYMLVGASTN